MCRLNSYITPAVTIESLTDIEDGINDNPGHSITTKPNQMENGSRILDLSAPDDTIINTDKTTEDNLNHQRCISQDEGIENNTASIPIRKKIQRNISLGSLNSRNALCCKVSVIFGVCCVIGVYLIPITLYYVGQTRDNPKTDPEFSPEKNTSTAKVCCKLNVDICMHR